MSKEADIQILSRLREGDESALKTLFDSYYMPLCIYSMQLTDSLEASEDLVQELFITFWEKKAYRVVEASLSSYLYGMIRNMSLMYMRENRPNALQEFEESLLNAYEEEEEYTEVELQQRRERLLAALKELSPQEYKVLHAIVFEDKRYKEVAEELHISTNSVKTYLSRALKFLRSKSLLSVLFHVAY